MARRSRQVPGAAVLTDNAAAFVRMVQMQAKVGCALSRLVVTHGRQWLASDVLSASGGGTPRECFANAARLLVETPSLTYVEGFACTRHLPLAVHHAWVIDEEGRVLDPTWEDGEAYWGLPVARGALCERLLAKRTFGLFDGPGTQEWVQRHLRAGTLIGR